MKIKKVTWEELGRRYIKGFNRLKYKVNSYKVSYRPSHDLNHFKLECTFIANLIHLRKQDVTYVALTCVGFFMLAGPSDDAETLVFRMAGNLTDLDDLPQEWYHAALDELYSNYEEKLKDKKEG